MNRSAPFSLIITVPSLFAWTWCALWIGWASYHQEPIPYVVAAAAVFSLLVTACQVFLAFILLPLFEPT